MKYLFFFVTALADPRGGGNPAAPMVLQRGLPPPIPRLQTELLKVGGWWRGTFQLTGLGTAQPHWNTRSNGNAEKTQEILRHLGTQKCANFCLKCTKIRLAAGLCLYPLGWKGRRTIWGRICGKDESWAQSGSEGVMDGDSGDEGNDELTCVWSDKSDKSSWPVGRRSSLGS